jgi:hypothetical protein
VSDNKTAIWKVRIKKTYPEATNHVVVGELLAENGVFVRLRCRAFHFRRPVKDSNIRTSGIKTRTSPWAVISYVTELPAGFDWEHALAHLDASGDVVFAGPGEEMMAPVSDIEWPYNSLNRRFTIPS